jgi:hypothetical protein
MWENNIKLDVIETDVYWIQLAWDRVQKGDFVNTLMNRQVPQKARKLLTS